MTGTNLDTSITVRTGGECEGAIAVPAERLNYFLSNLPSGGDISIVQKESSVECRCGSAKYVLPTMSEAEFPGSISAPIDATNSFEFEGKFLSNTLKHCAQACASEKNRTYLMGAWFFYGSKPSIIATDSYIAAEEGAPTMHRGADGNFSIPSGAIPSVLSACNSEKSTIEIDGRAVQVSSENVRVRTKMLDSDAPPPFDRAIPRNQKVRGIVSWDDLYKTVSLGTIIKASGTEGGVAKVRFANGKLSVGATNNGEVAFDECDCETGDEPFEFLAPIARLKWAISVLSSHDTIEISGNSPISAINFIPLASRSSLRLVYPRKF